MNPLQNDKLDILASDELLLNALYKLFFDVAENNRPEIKDADDNNLLGEKYRAYELSKQIINAGFVALQSYKKGDKSAEKQLNRAR